MGFPVAKSLVLQQLPLVGFPIAGSLVSPAVTLSGFPRDKKFSLPAISFRCPPPPTERVRNYILAPWKKLYTDRSLSTIIIMVIVGKILHQVETKSKIRK